MMSLGAGPVEVSAFVAVRQVPRLLSPVAGVLIDRFPQKRLLLIANALGTAAAICLVLTVDNPTNLGFLLFYVAGFVAGLAEVLFWATTSAYIRVVTVLPRSERDVGNCIDSDSYGLVTDDMAQRFERLLLGVVMSQPTEDQRIGMRIRGRTAMKQGVTRYETTASRLDRKQVAGSSMQEHSEPGSQLFLCQVAFAHQQLAEGNLLSRRERHQDVSRCMSVKETEFAQHRTEMKRLIRQLHFAHEASFERDTHGVWEVEHPGAPGVKEVYEHKRQRLQLEQRLFRLTANPVVFSAHGSLRKSIRVSARSVVGFVVAGGILWRWLFVGWLWVRSEGVLIRPSDGENPVVSICGARCGFGSTTSFHCTSRLAAETVRASTASPPGSVTASGLRCSREQRLVAH